MKKFVSVSGGKDSTATALLLWERGENFELIWADTGAELPENYWIVPRLAQLVQKPLHVVSNGTFFQWLQYQGYFLPGARLKWCTRILKQEPMDHYLAKLEIPIEVNQGIRADEPKRVRSNNIYRPGCKNLCSRYPLYEAGFGKKEVIDICLKYDLLNPVYAWRSSVSCFCCPLQRKGDWQGLLRHYPNLFAVAEEWERQSIATSAYYGRSHYTWNNEYALEELRKWGGRDPSRHTKAQLRKQAYALHNLCNGTLWSCPELKEADYDPKRSGS
jgi:3'-phosphoadenosine 5'-phosphosulfate sulfotransferase (PAPS reductase)/FAD synthetase